MLKFIKKTIFSALALAVSAQVLAHSSPEHMVGVMHNVTPAWNLLDIALLVIISVVVIRYFFRIFSK